MKCPDTPNSVIGELLKIQKGPLWQKSWVVFFDIYYNIVRSMTINSLKKIGWSTVPESDVEDIIAKTFLALLDAFSEGRYEHGKYRFRGFLKRIISRRTIDYIRTKNRKRTVNLEAIEIIDALESKERGEKYFDTLEDNESREYRKSVILDIWENIRRDFSPETCACFEMAILQERSVSEICEFLNVERTKVDKSVHRIVKKIREEIGRDFYRKELSK